MGQSRQTGSFVGQEFAARRALRKGLQELAAFHQGRLSAVDGVWARALTIMSLMISVTAL